MWLGDNAGLAKIAGMPASIAAMLLRMTFFPSLSSVSVTLLQLVPISALVAVIVFILREALEWRRRKKTEARKLSALKRIIAHDCELNYWAFLKLRAALIEMKKISPDNIANLVSITSRKSGGHYFQINEKEGWPLRNADSSLLHKHLMEIASIDSKLLQASFSNLNGLAEFDNIYRMTTEGPEPHFDMSNEDFYDGLIDYALAETERSILKLKDLYLICTGNIFISPRLR